MDEHKVKGPVRGPQVSQGVRRKVEVVERRQSPDGVYQLQTFRCGKKKCRCARGGELHGPYWVLLQVNPETGRWRTKYVGANLPDGV